MLTDTLKTIDTDDNGDDVQRFNLVFSMSFKFE